MAKLTITNEAAVPRTALYPAGPTVLGLDWCKQLSPSDFSLRLVLGELSPGAVFTWGEHHQDEALFLLSGEVDVDGHVCPAGGAVIGETGVAVTLTANSRTQFLHAAPSSNRDPSAVGTGDPSTHGLHVVGPGG